MDEYRVDHIYNILHSMDKISLIKIARGDIEGLDEKERMIYDTLKIVTDALNWDDEMILKAIETKTGKIL